MAFTISVGIPYVIKISFIFSQFIESKACEKSINRRVAGRFLDFTHYLPIRRMVKHFLVVDLFVRKPLLFFLSIGSISGLILFNKIRLYILAASGVSVFVIEITHFLGK